MPARNLSRLRIGLLLALCGLFLAVPGPALAARFLTVRIERDGIAILESGFGASDEEALERLWGRLQDIDLEEVAATPLAAGKQEITLEGNLEITILHVEQDLVRVEADKLLLRRNAAGDKWRLPPAEVERTALLGRLDVTRLYPPAHSSHGVLMAVAAVAGGVLIALAIALLMLWVLRRSSGQQPAR